MKLFEHDRLALEEAERSEVNAMRNRIQSLPLEVDMFEFDADEGSMRSMAEAIELAPNFGTTELKWTLANNKQHTFKLEFFNSLYQSLRVLRAARAQQVHEEALSFKSIRATKRDLENWLASYVNEAG